MYLHRHKVQFYECDMMNVVHHSNYLRFYEEARVGWACHHGLLDYQKPETASRLAVLETWVRHLRPARFGDELEIQIQGKLEGIYIIFEYKTRCPSYYDQSISVARTTHVPLNKDLKVTRPSPEMCRVFDSIKGKNQWIETWLSNL